MSFYSNRGRGGRPGSIDGDATDGLRNRVCISVKRVLDSCKKQATLDNLKLPFEHKSGKEPLKFIGATSTSIDAIVTELQVTRLEQRPYFARVKCTIVIPISVTYQDADGEIIYTTSEIRVPQDIVMYVPEASIFPFEIVASASCTCPKGEFKQSEGSLCMEVTACFTIITKVVANTDLLIPSYGYCPMPDAVNYEDQVCNKFFELPLYPK
jgi:hypothetical protein